MVGYGRQWICFSVDYDNDGGDCYCRHSNQDASWTTCGDGGGGGGGGGGGDGDGSGPSQSSSCGPFDSSHGHCQKRLDPKL